MARDDGSGGNEVDPDVHAHVHVDTDDDDADDDTVDPTPLGLTEAIEPLPPVSDPVLTARRKHGAAGAMLAAGMFGVDIALGRKPKEEAPVVVDANSDPVDIEKDGIVIPIDAHSHVFSPPLPPTEPRRAASRKGKGRFGR